MAAIQSKAMSHALTSCQFSALFIPKSLTDLTTTTHQSPSHTKIQTEVTTTAGLEVFSQSLHQSEDTMLTLTKLVTGSARSTGEKMLNLLSLRMDGTCHLWTPDQERPGDFGIGSCLSVEDGRCGDTSIPTTMEEPGLGLTHNLTQIAEPFECLLMIRIFIFLISIYPFFKPFILLMKLMNKNRFFDRILKNFVFLSINYRIFILLHFCLLFIQCYL